MMIARTPAPPYYAAIFSILRAKADEAEFLRVAERMAALAREQDGFLGAEECGETPEGFSVSTSYWRDDLCIRRWKDNAEHRIAQEFGRTKWFSQYRIRIARVERDYGFD